MDRNTIIGLTLIFILFIGWQQFMAPSADELEAQQRMQDSLAMLEQEAFNETDEPAATDSTAPSVELDSAALAQYAGAFGPFAPSATGEEEIILLENKYIAVSFSSKGGRIKEVLLKEYFKMLEDKEGKVEKIPLKLLEDDKNSFGYFIPLANMAGGGIRTTDLYFQPTIEGQTISFRADAGDGRYIEQVYTLHEDEYVLDYDVNLEGMNSVMPAETESIALNWEVYLDKLEKNDKYERNYSSLYFKPADDDVDYCSCTSDDIEDLQGRVKWISNSNQFFNSALIAESAFSSGVVETQMLDEDAPDLKKLISQLNIPFDHSASESFAMTMYVGPNEFERLRAIGNDLEDVIPFGWSIFGTINRWIIRPIFSFLSGFISNKGLVILALTLIVKIVLFPLTYKMLYSQSKMGALKPQLEGLKGKFKDDSQKQQMEQMKLYREFGVNPLGGCMPMVLQMPIWFALYRFFPASIEFRQAGFLWANDLSSYDAWIHLPFEVPMGFGAHISLFTVLWAITTLIYTYYNTRHMDMSANPAMKYMQYLMPLFFLGFFNSFASGLTAYLLFSNLINIGQTILTKNVIIDQEKIKRELEAYRKKPKKKGGFQERLEKALKDQQKAQADKENKKKKGSKT